MWARHIRNQITDYEQIERKNKVTKVNNTIIEEKKQVQHDKALHDKSSQPNSCISVLNDLFIDDDDAFPQLFTSIHRV